MTTNRERVALKLWNALVEVRAENEQLRARVAELETALAEAMLVRHYCDMEDQIEPDDPYRYDEYLQQWAEALGRRVESAWPVPGKEKAVNAAGGE